MWSIYQGEAEKYDKAVTGAQKEDANGVLVFVRYNLLLVLSPLGLTSSKDWSVLRSRRRVHCRELQEIIPRLRRYDNGSSHPDITATRWFPQ